MKNTAIIILLGAAFTLAGCFQKSLNPFYTNESLVDIKGLEGSWRDGEGYVIRIARSDRGKYEMEAVDPEKGSVAKLDVHTFKLGGEYYLDFYPSDLKPEIPNVYFLGGLLGTHSLAKARLDGDRVDLALLDAQKISNWFKAGTLAVSGNSMASDEVVLTGSSEALQVFLLSLANSEDAYSKDAALVWKRIK